MRVRQDGAIYFHLFSTCLCDHLRANAGGGARARGDADDIAPEELVGDAKWKLISKPQPTLHRDATTTTTTNIAITGSYNS